MPGLAAQRPHVSPPTGGLAADTQHQVVVAAVLSDYLSALQACTSATEVAQSVTGLAGRRRRWLQYIASILAEARQAPIVTPSPERPAAPPTRSLPTPDGDGPAHTLKPKGLLKSLEVLKAPKFFRKNRGKSAAVTFASVTPPASPAHLTPASPRPCTRRVSAGNALALVTSEGTRSTPYLNQTTSPSAEVEERLIHEIIRQVGQMRRDPRCHPVSLAAMDAFLRLLNYAPLRTELRGEGQVEDLVWLYAKAALASGVPTDVLPVSSPIASPPTSLPNEIAVIVSVVKLALTRQSEGRDGLPRRGSEHTLYTTPQLTDLHARLLHRLATRADWVTYVQADTLPIGPAVAQLPKLFREPLPVVLQLCATLDPPALLRSFAARFRTYHAKLCHHPVSAQSVNHLYSHPAYDYWLTHERATAQALVETFGEGERRLATRITSGPPPPGNPAAIHLPPEPHRHYNELVGRLLDHHLVRPRTYLTEKETLAELVSLTPAPTNALRHSTLPQTLSPEAARLLHWCGQLWFISVPFQVTTHLREVLHHVRYRRLPLLYLEDAVRHANATMTQVPHRYWSHFDNDTMWGQLTDARKCVDHCLADCLGPIDYFPSLDPGVEMPTPIKVRTSLRWYTLRSLLVVMELLSRNSLVLYYDAQLRDYAEPLRARIHGSFTGWYRFWREQYAAGDRVQSPAESVLGYAELLRAITTTYTLGENVFGPGNANPPTAAAGDGDDYERYGYPALLSPCRAYLDTTLGTYLNDFEAWLTALQRIPPVPLAGASAGPALDFEHCAHLLAVLDATARLSERAFGKSKVGPLARRFARLFLTQLLRTVQARSGDWVVSALQADKPTEPDATDGVVYSTSVDDVLCCVVEPFDLVRSVPNLDPTLRTWTLEHLMGLVYRTLAVYCAAMTEKFMEGLAVTAPGAASTAPAYPSSTRLEAWANRARVWTRLPGEASPSLSTGTTTGPNHPLLVLDPTACLPLNNLFQVSRRIHELFAPYLTGPAPPHPLANVANGDGAANFRLSRARNSLRRPAGLPARVPSTPCGANDHSSDAVHALTVTVVHGEGLEPRARARPRSPYVKLALPHLGLKVGKTGDRAATLVPRWDEAFPLWFGGREVQTNLGTATLSTTPVPLTMTVALYDRDGLQGGTLFALGRCTLDLTRLAMDRNVEDVWVDLKPRGRVLLRLAYADHGLGGTDATRPRAASAGHLTDAVDFDRDPLDIQHTYTCVAWLLRRSLDDLARRIVESIIPVVQRELTAERLLPPNRRLAALKRSGQQLRRLLAGGDTLPSDRRTGSPRPSTATIAAADPSAHPASESEGPLDDLFHFLNSNLAVLFQHAHFAISRPVILSIWREIVLALELVLLPSLPRLRAITGQDTRPVLTPDPSLTSSLSPATHPSSSPPLPRPARPSFLGNRAPLAHLAHASRKLIPAGLRTKTPQLPIEDVDFLWECLDAIEWFFLGGDTAAHRRVLTAADLHEIPEYRAVAYIRDHYFDSTPRLIRDYMHTTGERLRIAQRWEGFGGATATAAMANEDLMAAVELVDPIGPTAARASPDVPPPNPLRRDSAQPDSPGRVPMDQPTGADNFPGAVSIDWLRTKIDIVLRILQTRYGLDDEAVDFVDSHHADAVI